MKTPLFFLLAPPLVCAQLTGQVQIPAAPQAKVPVTRPTLKGFLAKKYGRRFDAAAKRHSFIAGSTGAVGHGLTWLCDHQSPDGRWSADGFMDLEKKGKKTDGAGQSGSDIGLTGLALLCLLADGQLPAPRQPRGKALQQGLEFLVSQQAPKTGLIGTNARLDFIYHHAIATVALVEAAGLSGQAWLRAPAQAALNYLERHRNPYGCWRYQPRDNDNDTSVTSWATMALTTGQDFGFKTSKQAPKLIDSYLQEMTDDSVGRVGYTRRGGPSARNVGDHRRDFPPEASEAMTGAGTFARMLLAAAAGDRRAPKVVAKSVKLLLERLPKGRKPEEVDFYYWMYASQVLRQAGGKAWKLWAHELGNSMVMRQRRDGNFKGSWDGKCVWGGIGGRVYATAMAVLTLQAETRYGQLLEPLGEDAGK